MMTTNTLILWNTVAPFCDFIWVWVGCIYTCSAYKVWLICPTHNMFQQLTVRNQTLHPKQLGLVHSSDLGLHQFRETCKHIVSYAVVISVFEDILRRNFAMPSNSIKKRGWLNLIKDLPKYLILSRHLGTQSLRFAYWTALPTYTGNHRQKKNVSTRSAVLPGKQAWPIITFNQVRLNQFSSNQDIIPSFDQKHG
jgi:hypothetical protein